MMKVLVGAVALVTLTMFSGCASIVNDKNQKINVSASNGQIINGTVDGVPFTGPGVVEVARANVDKTVVINNPECANSAPLNKSVDPMFFGNILIGGLLGSTTDASTEKMWKYQDKVVVSCK
jgi:hypothetical protein